MPLILLNHWGAVLDNFDPRIIDGLSGRHRVVAIDYRGIGASGGTAPVTVEEMALDIIAVIRASRVQSVHRVRHWTASKRCVLRFHQTISRTV